MNKRKKKQLFKDKDYLDLFAINYLDTEDKAIIKYVNSKILEIKTSSIVAGKTVNISDAYVKAVQGIQIFGDDAFFRGALLVTVPRYLVNEPYAYNCFIGFNIDCESMEVDRSSGVIKEFRMPRELDETAPVLIGHELVHALKDTNYEEFKLSMTLSDVIPIFYELISTEDCLSLRSKILNIRIDSLVSNAMIIKDY